MAVYDFGQNSDIRMLAQVYSQDLAADDPIAQRFPDENLPYSMLVYEQYDYFTGMAQWRGYDQPPRKVDRKKTTRFAEQPGVWGEFMTVSEMDMVVQREPGTWADVWSTSALVSRCVKQLMMRRQVRKQYMWWQLLLNRQLTVTDDKGAIVDQRSAITMRTFTPTNAYSSLSSSTPIADFRTVKLLARGYSVSFGRDSVFLANQKTVNNIISNTNASDLGGKRLASGATFNSLSDVNSVLIDNDLPVIQAYDGGYYDDNGVFQLFIPDGYGLLIGKRMLGEPLGRFFYTLNAVNGGSPGTYEVVFDRRSEMIPPLIEVHAGFNGGPVVEFPSGLILFTGI